MKEYMLDLIRTTQNYSHLQSIITNYLIAYIILRVTYTKDAPLFVGIQFIACLPSHFSWLLLLVSNSLTGFGLKSFRLLFSINIKHFFMLFSFSNWNYYNPSISILVLKVLQVTKSLMCIIPTASFSIEVLLMALTSVDVTKQVISTTKGPTENRILLRF